ncbi:acyltransferase [Enterobacter asburiae]|uniref:acyltransferase family protein n=1 Tax=Enterobacter asburiae TaxID=61645 RepID=UPI001F3FD047|nr:acyltransferase [Enterobacter asburiae]MCF1340495.1 acyltransferase [Enterobacter asburiae]MCM6999113.1 acyltransferase [Enterobacter asburiae]MCQ4338874.1 acyltransferase [Enterobacter asburiae]HDC4533314.1 acyltransferase [Enterobacter asburiae]
MNSKILSIHYLRGIAALLVVFFHFSIYLDNYYVQKDLGWILFGGGAFGVDLFFMISGFVIVLSTKNSNSKSIFLVRRFFRVYPPFIFIFAIGSLTVYNSNSLLDLVRASLLIHKDYSLPSPSFGFNILGTAWTLTYELYFYLTFVIAMGINHKYRVVLSSLFLITPILVLQLLYTGSLSFSGDASPNIPQTNPLYGLLRFVSSPILVEFIIGMVFYEIFTKVKIKITEGTTQLILALSCGLFLTFYFGNFNNEFGMHGFGIWSIILLFGVLTYDKQIGIKENKLFNLLGDISFSLYISHYIFVNAIAVYSPNFFASMSGISKFFFMTTLTGTAAIVMHNVIEKPSIKIGKRIEMFLKQKKNDIAPINKILT